MKRVLPVILAALLTACTVAPEPPERETSALPVTPPETVSSSLSEKVPEEREGSSDSSRDIPEPEKWYDSPGGGQSAGPLAEGGMAVRSGDKIYMVAEGMACGPVVWLDDRYFAFTADKIPRLADSSKNGCELLSETLFWPEETAADWEITAGDVLELRADSEPEPFRWRYFMRESLFEGTFFIHFYRQAPLAELPVCDSPYYSQIVELMDAYGGAYGFPAFENLNALDVSQISVLGNLFIQAERTPTAQCLQRKRETAGSSGLLACREDMEALGKRLFGDAFQIPEGADCGRIFPLPDNPDIYGIQGGCGPTLRHYFPWKITEKDNLITARMYVLAPTYNGDGELLAPHALARGDYVRVGDFIPSETRGMRGEEDNRGNLERRMALVVPPETWDVLTVTFARADSGHLYAVGARYDPA